MGSSNTKLITARQLISAHKTDCKALKRAANGEMPLGHGWSKMELDKLVSIFRKMATKRKLSAALSAVTILQLLVNKRTEATFEILDCIPAAIIEIAYITMR